MDCFVCQGACCEVLTIPIHDMSEDEARWLAMRGPTIANGRQVMIESPCINLTLATDPPGQCGIYDDRPQVCRDFLRGGQHCLDAVQARRTREHYIRIRGDEDPSVEEIYETTFDV